MKENIIKTKSFEFALRIVKFSQFLQTEKKEFTISKQVLRSGTSIGANIREAEHAESKIDFIHKVSIALKEANECEYWLELLLKSEIIDDKMYMSLNDDLSEILKLLISIIKTSKINKNI